MSTTTLQNGPKVPAGVAAASSDGRAPLATLLAACGRHDEDAFARFYQLTSPWIFYLLRRRTDSIADAEDALRLVYVTIWQRASSFEPNQSALAWVTTIANDLPNS